MSKHFINFRLLKTNTCTAMSWYSLVHSFMKKRKLRQITNTNVLIKNKIALNKQCNFCFFILKITKSWVELKWERNNWHKKFGHIVGSLLSEKIKSSDTSTMRVWYKLFCITFVIYLTILSINVDLHPFWLKLVVCLFPKTDMDIFFWLFPKYLKNHLANKAWIS